LLNLASGDRKELFFTRITSPWKSYAKPVPYDQSFSFEFWLKYTTFSAINTKVWGKSTKAKVSRTKLAKAGRLIAVLRERNTRDGM
jgi:hypothetical protein